MNGRTRTIAGIIGASTLLVACGNDSNSELIGLPVGTPTSPRTVEIAMVDIAYEPVAVKVRPGETIQFSFINKGVLPHEAIFGDGVVQDDHETEMQSAPGSPDGMDMGETTDTHADDTTETDPDMDPDMDMGETADTHADDTTETDDTMDPDMDMGETTDTHDDDTTDMDTDTDMAETTDTHADDATETDDTMDPDMDMGHDELGGPPSLSLDPGETGEIIITFDEAYRSGTIIGCHVPGHWVAGMRIDVAIESA